MFDSNLARHVIAFPSVNTSYSSSSQLNPIAATPWQLEQISLLEEEGETREGTAAMLRPMARPMTRSMTATERLQSPNYRVTQPATPGDIPDDDDVPGLDEDDTDKDLPGLIDDDDDFLPTTRRRPPMVP